MNLNLNDESSDAVKDQSALADWYLKNARELPWRISQDPYRIWISEVMLQQTTVTAVIPFYERFLAKFPTVHSLAAASIEDVYSVWSGLGYYSRARNLHKASLSFAGKGFPKNFSALMEMPGLGPYTARAVASLAFEEKVGVVDGNVIRILARKYGLATEWWKNKERDQFQLRADQLANHEKPSMMNQAMMELGATVCTPKKPLCVMCPWMKTCVAFAQKTVMELPLPKPRKSMEFWIYQPELHLKTEDQKTFIGLTSEHDLPFLKKNFLLPGAGKRVEKRPIEFQVKHTITHHHIFVLKAIKADSQNPPPRPLTWVEYDQASLQTPSILLKKILEAVK